MSLTWTRAFALDLGTGWITTVPDGRIAAVVEREHEVLGLRWFVYARPHDCESWGHPYELNGFGSIETAKAYVERGFCFPPHPRRAAAIESLTEASAQIDRINGGRHG